MPLSEKGQSMLKKMKKSMHRMSDGHMMSDDEMEKHRKKKKMKY